MSKLPPATLRTLQALWEQDDMGAHYNDVWHMSGVKGRAFYPLIKRMEAKNYVTGGYSMIYLTVGGMLAIKGHFEALYNDRPCDAHLTNFKKYERFPDRIRAV